MATENSLITTKSVNDLSGRWGLGIGACFVSGLVAGFAGLIPFGSIVVGGPMTLGLCIFGLAYARNEEPTFEMIFDGFKQFETSCPLYIVRAIFVLLWSLLLIIPGIIAAMAYSQSFYLIVDDPSLGIMDALRKSKEMMDGHKMRYFGLCMRMFGWAILCLFTIGIGFFWLIPYSTVAFANFYDDLNPSPTEFDITDHLV